MNTKTTMNTKTMKSVKGSRPATVLVETPDGALRPATEVEVALARLRMLWRLNGYADAPPEAIERTAARIEARARERVCVHGGMESVHA